MGHNYLACQHRSLEERTFFRKDHLQQHLKLIHNSRFNKWPMDRWKVESQDIRSQCGFCGLSMESWSDRADHIAQHFREGKTMDTWHGDWGFEAPVLDMVENAIAPCESNSKEDFKDRANGVCKTSFPTNETRLGHSQLTKGRPKPQQMLST